MNPKIKIAGFITENPKLRKDAANEGFTQKTGFLENYYLTYTGK